MELLETKQVIFSAKRLKMLLNLCRLNLTKDLVTLSFSLVFKRGGYFPKTQIILP